MKAWFWVCIVLLSVPSFALEIDLFAQMQVAEDNDKTTTIDTLDRLNWQPSQGPTFNPAFSNSVFWLQTEFSISETRVVVVADMPLHDDITLWLLNEQSETLYQQQTGDRFAYSSRPLNRRHFAFPLDLNANETYRLVIRVDTYDGLYDAIPLTMFSESAYQESLYRETLVYGLYYGAILVLFLYHLLLWVRHRDPDFRRYAFYLAAFFVFSFSFRGYAGQWFWPNNPWLNNQIIPLSVIVLYYAIYAFSTGFLQTKQLFPKSHRVYSWVIATLFIPFILAMFGHYALTYQFLIPQALLVLTGVFYLAIRASMAGAPSARIFLLAWSFLLVSGIVYVLRVANIIPSTFWVEHAIDVGSTIENLLLAFALAEKLNKLQRQRNEAEKAATQAQRQLNDELERLVEERTRELIKVNEKLEVLVQQDPLTGLMNRRPYDATLHTLCQRSVGTKKPLALLIIDLDNFKAVNDELGHHVGDATLIAFSQLASQHWRREYLFRLGGDEFSVIISDVSEAQLRQRLQAFMTAFEQLQLPNPACKADIQTLSIGAVLVQCVSETRPNDLFIAADKALYSAKEKMGSHYVIDSMHCAFE